jgi:hypothetical protein
VGVSIGIAVARNFIGWTPGGVESPAQVQAYLSNTSVVADGKLSLTAVAGQSIDSLVIAGSAAVGAGGSAGVGVSGSGVWAENKIGVDVKAYIDGDRASGTTGISAASISLSADDSSAINALAGAASLAAAVGGAAGVGVSVGVSLARNTITSEVAAYILNAEGATALPGDFGITATSAGGITISATERAAIHAVSFAASLAAGFGGAAGVAVSGAGADANNIILTDTRAYIQGSVVRSAGKVDIDAANSAKIDASVVSASFALAIGGYAGVGASIGAAVARNQIGTDATPLEVLAYLQDSRLVVVNDLSLLATSTQTIEATVFAGSVAFSGGIAGVGLSGAGAGATNGVTAHIKAYIDGDSPSGAGVHGLHAGSVSVKADDHSTITANTGAAALSASFGAVGVSISIGVGQATNTIANQVEAYVKNVDGNPADATDDGLSTMADYTSARGATNLTTGDRVKVVNIPTQADFNTLSTQGVLVSGALPSYATKNVAIQTGQTLRLAADYTSASTQALIRQGDFVQVVSGSNAGGTVGAIYRYVGPDLANSTATLDLSLQDYSQAANWALVGGDAGALYRYLGVAGSINLKAQDFTDASWAKVAGKSDAIYKLVGASNEYNLLAQDYTDTAYWQEVTPGDIEVEALNHATIDATSAAASAALAGGVFAGISLSGAGADAHNIILSKTHAWVENSDLGSARDLIVHAADTATIESTVISASASLGGGLVGVAVSIGASTAKNSIGYTAAGASAPAEVMAYVKNASVDATRDLVIGAVETATISARVNAITAALSGGGVAGAGAGAGTDTRNRVQTQVLAYVDTTRGSHIDIGGAVRVTADDHSTITADTLAASVAGTIGVWGGSVAIGVAIAENEIGNRVEAYLKSATIDGAPGGVTVVAEETAGITATAQAAAIAASFSIGAALSGGGARTGATVTTVTRAYVDSSHLTLTGDLSIDAKNHSSATARVDVTSASFGLIAIAVAGSDVAASISPTVEAYITSSAIKAADVTVSATADPSADLEARGFSVSSGASVGVSQAVATLAPTVTAYVGSASGQTIAADSLAVSANLARPSGGTGNSAEARAVGSAGGLLLGVDATVTRVTNTGTARSYVVDYSTLDIQGATTVGARNTTRQVADSSSDAYGLLAAGITKATVTAATTTEAYLGTGVKLTGGSLTISAYGSDDNTAATTAGAGGVVAGAAARPQTINTSIVTAEIRAGTAGRGIDLSQRGSGEVTLSADHLATFNATVRANAAGFLSGAGADSDHTITSNVTAAVRDGVVLTARQVEILADNRVAKPALADGGSNLSGSAKALVGVAGAFSNTTLSLTTLVKVGDADITVVGPQSDDQVLILAATNRMVANEKVTFTAAGLGAGAKVNTTIETQVDLAKVEIAAGARLIASGIIVMSARGSGQFDIQANAEANGGVGVVVGTSTVDIRPRNEVLIGQGAKILGAGGIWLSAGRSGDFESDAYELESRIDSYSSAVIPVDDIDANAFILQDNLITVETGALLQTAGEARLHAERLGVNQVRVGAAGHSWAANLFSAPSQFEDGDSLSEAHATILMNGTVETGIQRRQNLTLTAWQNGTDTVAPNIRGFIASDGVAENAIATARVAGNFQIGAVGFDLVYDAVKYTIDVAANATLSTQAQLIAHIQSAVDAKLGTGKVVVLANANGAIGFGLPDVTLTGQAAATATIAAGRSGNNLTSDRTLTLTYDGQAVQVTVAAGNFSSADALRDHVQAAVDARLIELELGNPGDINVVVGSGGAMTFERGLLARTWHALGAFQPGFTNEVVTVKSQLLSQIEFAQAQIALYPNNGTLVAFYQGEVTRMTAELADMGLLDTSDPNGRTAAIQKSALSVIINSIKADAGIIDLRSDQVTGIGQWLAPGDVAVTIDNQTPAFLKLAGIAIAESSGGLYMNGAKVTTGNAGLDAINQTSVDDDNRFNQFEGNVAKVAYPGFTKVPDGAAAAKPQIRVENTFNATVLPDVYTWNDITVLGGTQGSGIVAPTAELFLGTPQQGKGNVNIYGSIITASQTIVAGGSLYIGPVSQQEVAGKPYTDWALATFGPYGNGSGLAPWVRPATVAEQNLVLAAPAAGADASMKLGTGLYADRIIIEAEYLNINGILQSGYDKYELTLGAAAQAEIDAKLAKAGMPSRFLLTETSKASKFFSVYFIKGVDGQAGTIEVADRDVSGGYIDLTGHIMNTANGQIRALGGYGQISVINNTNNNLIVNDLDASKRGAGIVLIKDKSLNQVTLYQMTGDGLYKTTDTLAAAGTTTATPQKVADYDLGETVNYETAQGWRFGWDIGLSQLEIYKSRVVSSSWLFIPLGSDFEGPWDSVEVEKQPTLKDEAGYYYYAPTGTATFGYADKQSAAYAYDMDSVETYNSGVTTQQHTETSWTGKKTITVDYTQVIGKDITHHHSVKADRPIQVQFIGSTEGRVDIQSNGTGTVTIRGHVDNPTGLTTVSSNKRIETVGEDAFIGGRSVTLSAKTGLGGSTLNPLVTSLTDGTTSFGTRTLTNGAVKANYIDTGIGGLKATTNSGGVYLRERLGDLPIDQISAGGGGDVVISAPGSLSVGQNGATTYFDGRVQGGNITLVAGGVIGAPLATGQTVAAGEVSVSDSMGRYLVIRNGTGGVGNSATRPLVLDSGRLSASESNAVQSRVNVIASGDIYLREAAGDLRVETIYTGGNVDLAVPAGSVLDANSSERRDERTYEELKGGVWADLSLTRDLGALDKIEAARVTLRSTKEMEYQAYWNYRNQQSDPTQFDPNFTVSLSAAERQYYQDQYLSGADAAIAALEAKRTAEYRVLHGVYGVYGEAMRDPETTQLESVDGSSNTLVLSTNHTYATGDQLVYRSNGNTAITLEGGGHLIDGSVYYVINTASNAIRLARTAADALSGTAIDLKEQTLDQGRGTHSLRTGFIYDLTADEDAALTGSFKVWTEAELLFSVNQGLLKEVSKTTTTIEDPNISGAAVTINAQGRAGQAQGVMDIDLAALRQPPVNETMTVAGQTITRSGGVWDSAYYVVGKQIFLEGSAAGNNGAHVITGVAGNILTVDGNAFATETRALSVSITLTDDERVTLAAAERGDLSYLMNKPLSVKANFNQANNTITRLSGDGLATLAVGDFIQVVGNSANATDGQRFYRIAGIAGDVITLVDDLSVAPRLVNSELSVSVSIASVVNDPKTNVAASIDVDADTISLGAVHGYVTGAKVVYANGGNAGIGLDGGGTLADGATYYVIAIDSTTVKLATSYDNAMNGSALGLAGTMDTVSGAHSLSAGRLVQIGRISLIQDLDLLTSGAVSVTTGQQMYLGSEGSVAIKQVQVGDATTGAEARIKVSGSILRADGATATDLIRAGDLVLEAGDGAIGASANPILIDQVGAATLTARAKGDVFITETAGNLHLGTVYSATGGTRLGTVAGGIVDAYQTDFTKVKANWIKLDAVGGGIGADGNPVEIDVAVDPGNAVDALGTGTVTADAEGSIYLDETTGNMNVRQIKSSGGDVTLRAQFSIFDALNNGDADVIGNQIHLVAGLGGVFGTIGMSGNDLDIDSGFSGDGLLTTTSLGNTYLIETWGDLNLHSVGTGAGQAAFIAALAGSIWNGRTDGGFNVTSGDLFLFATQDVGQAAKPIITAVGRAEGQAINGSVFVYNSGNVDIGGVTPDADGIQAGGDIRFVAACPITVKESVTAAGNIIIAAIDDNNDSDTTNGTPSRHDDKDTLLVKGFDLNGKALVIQSTGGGVQLLAGDDLILEPDATVKAATRIDLFGDYQGGKDGVSAAEFDPGTDPTRDFNVGSVIDLEGWIEAGEEVRIRGHNGPDVVVIRHLTAPKASVKTFEGEDRVYLGTNATPTGSNNGLLDDLRVRDTLEIDLGAGVDQPVVIDDSGDTKDNVGVLTSTRLTGLGMNVTDINGNVIGGGISYANLKELNITLGSGADTFTIESTHIGATNLETKDGADVINVRTISGITTLMSGVGDDTINVGSKAAGTTSNHDLNTGGLLDGIDALLVIDGDLPDGGVGDVLNLDDTGDSVANTGILTDQTVTGLGLSPSGIQYAGIEALNILLGAGGDTFTIETTHAGTTNLETRDGADIINVRTISGITTLNSGGGSDTINVGTKAAGTTSNRNLNTGGLLDRIDALLVIDGDLPSGSVGDVLNLDDTGDSVANVGILTDKTVTGLGLSPAGIQYARIETLSILLGGGGDTFTMESTHVGATNLETKGGDDIINVKTISGITTLNGGYGSDTINVGTKAAGTTSNRNLNTGGLLDRIDALLAIDGDQPSGSVGDVLNLDDTGDYVANTGNLTDETVTGLGLSPAGIQYARIETLNVHLGVGVDTFTIESTHVGATNLETREGADIINVRTISGITTLKSGGGADTINVGTKAAGTISNRNLNTGGQLDGIDARLTIDDNLQSGGVGDVLNLDDTGDYAANTGILTDKTVTGLGLSPSGIEYAGIEALNILLGVGGDTFTINSIYSSATTGLDTGGGNDMITGTVQSGTLTIAGNAGNDVIGLTSTNTLLDLKGGVGDDSIELKAGGGQADIWGDDGNDAIRLTTSATPVTVYGGTGNDTFDLSLSGGVLSEVRGGDGSDTFRVSQSAGTVRLYGEAGDDWFVLGRQSNGTWRTDLLSGALTLDGGSGQDSLVIDDSGSYVGRTVTLDATTISGATSGSMNYAGFEALELQFGGGADRVTVNNTHTGLTTINTGAGNDIITVQQTGGVVGLAAGAGNDTITVRAINYAMAVSAGAGDDTIEVGGSSGVSAIRARLSLDGGTGTDKLVVSNNGTGTANLSMNALTGLGMTGSAGIYFQGLETVQTKVAAVTTLTTQTSTGNKKPASLTPTTAGTLLFDVANGTLSTASPTPSVSPMTGWLIDSSGVPRPTSSLVAWERVRTGLYR